MYFFYTTHRKKAERIQVSHKVTFLATSFQVLNFLYKFTSQLKRHRLISVANVIKGYLEYFDTNKAIKKKVTRG